MSMIFTLLLAIITPFNLSDKTSFISFISPLPEFLNRMKNKQVTLLDIWQPLVKQTEGNSITPVPLTAKSALLYDLTSGQTLFEQNSKERLPMASLTKIMTAIVALENKKSDDKYLAHGADLVGEDSMGITAGERLSLEDLLYGIFLHSGNDAAEVLASNFPGGRTAFIKAMNDKAAALGLSDTHFTNPTGLEGDGNQYTTSYDLLVITRYGLEHFPLFGKVAATNSVVINQTSEHKEFDLDNETNLLTSYPGVKGIKTGYTPEAGLCLVTYLDYSDHKIIGIILSSQNRRQEMKDLLDYSLKRLGINPPAHD